MTATAPTVRRLETRQAAGRFLQDMPAAVTPQFAGRFRVARCQAGQHSQEAFGGAGGPEKRTGGDLKIPARKANSLSEAARTDTR